MTPVELGAAITGGVVAVACLMAAWIDPRRRLVPEVLGLGALAAVLLLGSAPWTASAWLHLLLHPSLAGLAGLAGFGVAGSRRARDGAEPEALALGVGLAAGALAAAAVAVPAASSPRQAARCVWIGVCAGALLPGASAAAAVLAGGEAGWWVWVVAPAATCAALWPWTRGVRPTADRLVLLGVLTALAAVWLGPWAVGVGGAIAALTTPERAPEPSPHTPGPVSALRWAVAAHLLGAIATAGGAAWFAGRGLGLLVRDSAGLAEITAVTALTGALLEPTAVATILARGAELAVGLPDEARYAAALGLALSPTGALLVAARVHGRRAAAWGGLGALGIWAVAIAWAGWLGS